MATRSEPLRKLAHLVATAEEGTANLGPFIHQHPDLIGAILAVSEPAALAMAHLDDRALVPVLAVSLERHLDRQRQAWREKKEERASQAARLLGQRVLWRGDQAWLDLGLFFGEVLSTGAKLIVFSARGFEVALPRRKLVEVRAALNHRPDLVLFVDHRGAHFHWKAGRGQLNFRPQKLPPKETSVLTVLLGAGPSPQSSAVLTPPHGGAQLAAG